MDTRQDQIEITKRIVVEGGWGENVFMIDRFIEEGEPFLLVGKRFSMCSKLAKRIGSQHPDIPIRIFDRPRHIFDRPQHRNPWVAVIGADPLSSVEVHAEDGPVETAVVTPTPTRTDQLLELQRITATAYNQEATK